MDLINIYTIGALVIGLVVGAFAGVGLGRRSSTANKFYDETRREADRLREELRAERAKK